MGEFGTCIKLNSLDENADLNLYIDLASLGGDDSGRKTLVEDAGQCVSSYLAPSMLVTLLRARLSSLTPLAAPFSPLYSTLSPPQPHRSLP